MLKRALVVLFTISIMCASSYAKDKICVIDKDKIAQSPAGAVVETTGIFIGKITSAVEIAATGQRQLSVRNETGECRIFPFDATTKIVDATTNTATFNVLKTGKDVKVEYAEEGGVDKAKSVTVTK